MSLQTSNLAPNLIIVAILEHANSRKNIIKILPYLKIEEKSKK